jgi:hypothetical protein
MGINLQVYSTPAPVVSTIESGTKKRGRDDNTFKKGSESVLCKRSRLHVTTLEEVETFFKIHKNSPHLASTLCDVGQIPHHLQSELQNVVVVAEKMLALNLSNEDLLTTTQTKEGIYYVPFKFKCQVLGTYFPNLTNLNLSHCFPREEGGIAKAIIDNFPRLTHLNLTKNAISKEEIDTIRFGLKGCEITIDRPTQQETLLIRALRSTPNTTGEQTIEELCLRTNQDRTLTETQTHAEEQLTTMLTNAVSLSAEGIDQIIATLVGTNLE